MTFPLLFSYLNFEARKENSYIEIGKNTWINNNANFISSGPGIFIGSDCAIGVNVTIFDSDFHPLDPQIRMSGQPKTGKVVIGDNVFIGSNASILKGVTVGSNSVIGFGSIVTKDIPANTIACGNPAKIIRCITAT